MLQIEICRIQACQKKNVTLGGFRNPRGERSLFLWDGIASEFKRCISGGTFSRCSGSRWRTAWWCQSESGPEFSEPARWACLYQSPESPWSGGTCGGGWI